MYKTESENKSLIKSEISTYGLHIPDLMQNENFDGYFERFSICNGFKDAISANKFIKDNIRNTYPEFRYFTKVWYFSKIFNISMNQIIQKHTLLPLGRSLLYSQLLYQSEDESIFNIVLRNALPNTQSSHFFCRQCVNEDINYLGISYWRRDHALPGIEWCLKHNTLLEIAIEEGDIYKAPPSFYLENNLSEKFEASALLDQNHFLQRYFQLITDFFDLNFILDHNITKKVIVEKLVSISKLHCQFYFYQDLHKFMDKELPYEWVKFHFPKLLNNSYPSQVNRFYRNILSGTYLGKTLINYLLMTAVIFDDSDEALNKLKKAHLSSPSNIQSRLDTIS